MKSLFHRKLHIYTSYELSYEIVILPMKLHRKLHRKFALPGFRTLAILGENVLPSVYGLVSSYTSSTNNAAA